MNILNRIENLHNRRQRVCEIVERQFESLLADRLNKWMAFNKPFGYGVRSRSNPDNLKWPWSFDNPESFKLKDTDKTKFEVLWWNYDEYQMESIPVDYINCDDPDKYIEELKARETQKTLKKLEETRKAEENRQRQEYLRLKAKFESEQ